MLKAIKFGGSSVAGAEQFARVKAIVESDPARRLVVVSAAGKRSGDDHKLTDLLYLCHAHLTYGVSCGDILAQIRSRFTAIREELGLRWDVGTAFDEYCATLSRDTSQDELVSRGEYFTARLMAEYLGYDFVDAAECVLFGFDGELDREKTEEALREVLRRHDTLVLPGFYGSLPSGRIRVMSRGGSDITGALLAAAADADVYENWTDVSGILMADPKIVPNPRPIEKITYAELRELAFMGASVLHEESILPVKERGIPMNIRNTNRPGDEGTMIVEEVAGEAESERFLTGVAGRRNFTVLTVRKRDMRGSEELRRTLEMLDECHVQVEHIKLGLDSFALVASSAKLGENLYHIVARIHRDCRPDDVQVQDGIALVAAVGRKMTFRPGISGKLFRALGEQGVNIRTIAQGANELSIIIGVDNRHFETAIRILYEGFAG